MDERRLRAVDPRPEGRAASAGALTIEQLAQATGMTVRNIRNHQSRGLLPPPDVRARIGFYGDEHVARLRLIQEMQAEGFNLNAIKNLLGTDHGAADRLLGLRRAVTTPFEEEQPEILTADELAERFGAVSPKAMSEAQRLELIVPIGGGRFEAPSPALLRAAEEVMGRGVPLAAALSVVAQVKRNCEAVSRAFVKLFLKEVWKPFEDADAPEERWPEVMATIERLRPLASEVVLAVFHQTMSTQVEEAFGKELERRAKRGSRS